MNHTAELACLHPMNRGMGILPLLVAGVAAGGSYLASSQSAKAAGEQTKTAKQMAAAQVKVASLRRKTEREAHIRSLYSSPVGKSQTIFLAGAAALLLLGIVVLKQK